MDSVHLSSWQCPDLRGVALHYVFLALLVCFAVCFMELRSDFLDEAVYGSFGHVDAGGFLEFQAGILVAHFGGEISKFDFYVSAVLASFEV